MMSLFDARGVKKVSRTLDTAKSAAARTYHPGSSAEVTCISTTPMSPQSFSPERTHTPIRRKLTGKALHSGHHQRSSRISWTTETPVKFILNSISQVRIRLDCMPVTSNAAITSYRNMTKRDESSLIHCLRMFNDIATVAAASRSRIRFCPTSRCS